MQSLRIFVASAVALGVAIVVGAIATVTLAPGSGYGQVSESPESAAAAQPPEGVPGAAPERPAGKEAGQLTERQEWFRKHLSGSRLVGFFTTDGQQPPELNEERYEILSVQKMAAEDLWLFTTRIRYGEKDVTIPVPLPVKWAGKTPMITLDQVTIPALGTFDARVIITETKYAGTWRHGDVGGHLFGRIERHEPEE